MYDQANDGDTFGFDLTAPRRERHAHDVITVNTSQDAPDVQRERFDAMREFIALTDVR